MSINPRRLIIVLAVISVSVLSVGAAYRWHTKSRREFAQLRKSARAFIESGDYSSGYIVAEKMIQQRPNNASAYLLRGLAALAGKPPTTVRRQDEKSIQAIRDLLQAVRLDTNLTEAHELLLVYFAEMQNFNDAVVHANAVLARNGNSPDAHFVLGESSFLQQRFEDTQLHVAELIAHETPVRVRSLALALRLADVLVDNEPLKAAIAPHLGQIENVEPEAISDRIAKAQILIRTAIDSKSGSAIQSQVKQSLGDLRELLADTTTPENTPRRLLIAARTLLGDSVRSNVIDEDIAAVIEANVEEFVDDVFRESTERDVLDPAVYIEFAQRLVGQNRSDEAVALIRKSLETAQKNSAETRLAFTACDLWLAEHLLSKQQFDEADRHLKALLTTEQWRGWGLLLSGYVSVQRGELERAAESLREATRLLPEHGVTFALYGSCQLQRGQVSDGRQLLEKGIELGASQPQYKAWLALALAEAGDNDRALQVAQQVLADSDSATMSRALLGQIRARAGQLKHASEDIDAALQEADPEERPSLLIVQLELGLRQGNWGQHADILAELKQTSFAAKAYALEAEYLRQQNKLNDARAVLAKAREQFPDEPHLLAANLRDLIECKQLDEATEIIGAYQSRHSNEPFGYLLEAEIHELAGKPADAMSVLRKSLNKVENDTPLRIRLIEKAMESRLLDEAEKVLATLKSRDDVQPTTINYLSARLAVLRGAFDDAEKILSQAAQSDPNNPTIKFLLGQLAMQKGDYSAATQLLEQSLGGNAYRQQSIRALFDSLLRTGATDRAIDLLSRARQWGQPVRSLRSQLLGVLARREKWEAVSEQLDELLAEEPSEANYALAVSLLRYKRQPADAFRILKKGIATNDQSMILREQRVSLLLEHGRFAEADEELALLLKREAENPTLHVLRVYSLLESGRIGEADEAVADAWKLCRGYPPLAALRVQILLRRNQHQAALSFASGAKEQFDQLPDPRHLTARMYELIGRPGPAIELLNDVLDDDPANIAAAQSYLRLLVAEGRTEDFEQRVQQLIASNPDDPMLRGVLAEYYAALNDVTKLAASINSLEKLQVKGPLIAYLRALTAYAAGDDAETERWINQALAAPDGHVPSSLLFARLRARQGGFDEAIKLTSQLRHGRPSFAPAHFFFAQLMIQTKDFARAEKVCRQFLQTRPNAPAFRALMAQSLVNQESQTKKAEAVNIAQRELQSEKLTPPIAEQYLRILFTGGRSDLVSAYLEEYNHDDPAQLLAIARACFFAKQYRETYKVISPVVSQYPRALPAKMLLADTLVALAKSGDPNGSFADAVTLYENVVAVSPKNVAAANNLAWTLGTHLNQPGKAIQRLEQLVPAIRETSAKLPAELLDTIGTLHYKLDHLTEAQSFLERAIAAKPTSGVTHYHLGLVYQELQRADRARQHFTQALKLEPNADWAKKISNIQLAN